MSVRVHPGRLRLLLSCCLSVALAGCGTVHAVKKIVGVGDDTGPKVLSGFIGGVVADEPRAVLTAKQMLALGGNAADAAVTLGFMLTVTLPSRAALGGGGACLAYAPGAVPNKGVPEAIMFPPVAPATPGGERPAAVPTMARGLYLLSARYGSRSFAELLQPAEQAARLGVPVSRALAQDLAPVSGPLASDPAAAAIFAPGGVALTEGGTLRQPDLAGTLSQLSTLGVGDFYQGILAHRIADSASQAGGAMTANDLRHAPARLLPPIDTRAGADTVSFLPLPADGGLAATAAFRVLHADPAAGQVADLASQAAAARFRASAGIVSADALLAEGGAAPPLPALPASTSFVVVDRKGDAVACALTMNNLFGTGRVAPGTGILLAASPAAKPPPLLAAGIAWSPGGFRAGVGASGQNQAGLAAGFAMTAALAGASSPVPDPGRANLAVCPGNLPAAGQSCRFQADPRMAGLASGNN